MNEVLLKLPTQLANRLRLFAEASSTSIEVVMLKTLETYIPTPLNTYSDVQLWQIVKQTLLPQDRQRFELLRDKADESELALDETHEYEALLELIDQQMLARSEALAILKERGYGVEHYLRMEQA